MRSFCFAWLFCGLAAWSAPPPVILISIDTFRADHLTRAPQIQAFADHGTIYTAADAQVPLTLPSHTSLFTSTYPFENRIEENAEPVAPGAVTLAGILRDHGYKTAGFVASVFLEAEMGLNQGFDFYDSPFHFEAFSLLSGSMFFGGPAQHANSGRDRRDATLVTRAALQWLARNRNEPAFAFLHFYDLHKPYKLGSYDAEIEYVDNVLGSFRKALLDSGWWDRSLVIVLSDHGESLGDHGEETHGYFIYESTLHVPLVVHWPNGIQPAPARADAPVGLIDVAPTILDFLHLSPAPSFEGKSFLNPAPDRQVYAESLHAHDSFGWSPLRSLRRGDYKYIEAPTPELYNLRQDPNEKRNMAASNPGEAGRLHEALTKLLARYAPKQPVSSVPLSPQTRELLGSLGYLAAGPGVGSNPTGPDPKSRLAEFQTYEKAMLAVYDGKLKLAIGILTSILARDPKNTLARRDLGAAYLELHEYAKAREALGMVAISAPGDYMTQYELGVADERLNLLEQAKVHLAAACKLSPDAAQCRNELNAVVQRLR